MNESDRTKNEPERCPYCKSPDVGVGQDDDEYAFAACMICGAQGPRVVVTSPPSESNNYPEVLVPWNIVARAEASRKCVIGKSCSEHGFIHGGEAEELRSRLEELVDTNTYQVLTTRLQRLLDSCDARDSLAFLESK